MIWRRTCASTLTSTISLKFDSHAWNAAGTSALSRINRNTRRLPFALFAKKFATPYSYDGPLIIRLSLCERERMKVRDFSGNVPPARTRLLSERYQAPRELDGSRIAARQFRCWRGIRLRA